MTWNWRWSIGDLIRLHRSARGLSLTDLSLRTGLAISYLAQLEGGTRRNPTVETLIAIADTLNISPADLLPTAHAPIIPEPGVQLHVEGGPAAVEAVFNDLAAAVQVSLRTADISDRIAWVLRLLHVTYRHSQHLLAKAVLTTPNHIGNVLVDRKGAPPYWAELLTLATGIPLRFFRDGRF